MKVSLLWFCFVFPLNTWGPRNKLDLLHLYWCSGRVNDKADLKKKKKKEKHGVLSGSVRVNVLCILNCVLCYKYCICHKPKRMKTVLWSSCTKIPGQICPFKQHVNLSTFHWLLSKYKVLHKFLMITTVTQVTVV